MIDENGRNLFAMSAQELIDAGYNPFGVQVLKDAQNGVIPEERILELLERSNDKVVDKKVIAFEDFAKTKKELNRKERRLLSKRYRKQLERGK